MFRLMSKLLLLRNIMLFNWSFVLRDVQKASNLMSEEIRPRYIVTRERLLNATEIKKIFY